MIRQNWIDWAKAIGIYLVVVGHCTFTNTNIEGFIYTFHMPLFFLISGFLYKKEKLSITLYLKKLTNRLLVPYLFINLLITIWELTKFIIRGNNEFILIKEQLYGTLLGIPTKIISGPTWFLLALFWCQLFMYIYIRLNKIKYYSIVLMVSIIIFLLKHYSNYSLFWGLDTFPLGFLYFILMYYLKGPIYKLLKMKQQLHNIIASVLLFVVTFYLYKINGNSNLILSLFGKNFFLGFLGALTGSLGVLSLGYSLNNITIPFVKTVFSSTILILGFHMAIMNFVELHIYNFSKHTMLNFIISLLVVIIISLSFPLIRRVFPILVGYRK